MTKPAVYLAQFIGTSMIIGGGIVIARHIIAGEHNIAGWLTVILGILFLIVGTINPTKTKR